MRLERRRDGERFIIEAYGPDREALEAQRRRWSGSYVQWESLGIPLIGPDSQPRLTGPTWVLWRPAEPRSEPDELEDPADFLADFLAAPPAPPAGPPDSSRPAAPGRPMLTAPPAEPAPATPEPEPEPAAPEPAAPEPEPAPEQAPGPPQLVLPPEGAASEGAAAAPAVRRRGRPPQQAKSVRHKNITRVDRPARKMHGFHVRLGWKGQVYQKWFSDTTHGDRLGALAAALAWRDAKERELGKPRTEGMLKGQDRTSNTGIVGVAAVTLGGRPYYRALWRDADGRQHRRWFSVERLGEKRALRAAIKAREQGEAARLR